MSPLEENENLRNSKQHIWKSKPSISCICSLVLNSKSNCKSELIFKDAYHPIHRTILQMSQSTSKLTILCF
jgi:hypothetical protein